MNNAELFEKTSQFLKQEEELKNQLCREIETYLDKTDEENPVDVKIELEWPSISPVEPPMITKLWREDWGGTYQPSYLCELDDCQMSIDDLAINDLITIFQYLYVIHK